MIRFAIDRLNAGWLDATISGGGKKVTLVASYLSDAPRDLLMSCSVIAEGGPSSQCSWEDEPGEFRFLFRREGSNVEVSVSLRSEWR